MDQTAEGPDQDGEPPASSSPLSSPCRGPTQTWPPAGSPVLPPWTRRRHTQQDPECGMQLSPPSRFYEELFCTSRAPDALVPLAGALLPPPGPQSDVVKQGCLGKLERSHRRYFVLRAGSHTGPSRLEWYKSQEKFTAVEKSAGKAALFGSTKQGVIYLRCCLGVSRMGGARRGHTVALYAQDQTMVLVVQDQWEQEEWYLAIKKLMEEERKEEEHGEGFEEDDDGYCTLPPATFFKEVWPVRVKPRGLGCSTALTGESRLCLTATALLLVRVGACSGLPSVTIPLLSVRRFGHLDGSFFLELGRSAPNGPGEIWMEARDQGSPAAAQHIHEVVRDTVRALRALPDFSRSPISNYNRLQGLLAPKRCRPKYRDKLVNVRPLGSPLGLPPRNSESPSQSYLQLSKPDKTEPEYSLSPSSPRGALGSPQSEPESGSYMEMKTDIQPPLSDGTGASMVTADPRGVAACVMEGWGPQEEEEDEEEEEGLGYMMMSPQDDYVTMASPHKHDESAYSSPLHTSLSSSTSDSGSPLRPSHHQEHGQPHWLLLPPLQLETQETAPPREHRGAPQHPGASASTARAAEWSGITAPFVTSGPGCARPVQASPNAGTGRSSGLEAVSDQSVRRSRLSLCLPSCLQAEDRS